MEGEDKHKVSEHNERRGTQEEKMQMLLPGPLKSCSCGMTRGWQSDLEQASSSCLFFQTGAGHQGLVLEPMQQYPEMLFKWLQESFSKQESIERNGRKPRWVSISMEAAFTSSIVNRGVPL
ncbi:unnamed protein product [Arctogadus glacialis]